MVRNSPTIALFPEASFGAALNCVGIAQILRDRGARPVFICHPGFTGLFADYGFAEHHLPAAGGAKADTWQDFVRRHLPHFNLSPAEQLDTYVAPTWQAIVDTAIDAEQGLGDLLARLKPDAVVLDNVIMFPALATSGIPWVRVVSCAETELPDPNVPPTSPVSQPTTRLARPSRRTICRRWPRRTSASTGSGQNAACRLSPPANSSSLRPG